MAVPLNSGQFGRVYYPSLECEDPHQTPKGNYVSKLMKKRNAEAELRASSVARDLDWAKIPISMCKWNGKGAEQFESYDTLLFSEYAGQTMDTLPPESWSNPIVLKAYLKLIDSVIKWNKNCFHGDITTKNILWDGSKFYLIDFASAICPQVDPNNENYAMTKAMNNDMKSKDKQHLYENLLEVMDTNALAKWSIKNVKDLEKLRMNGGRRKRKTRRRV
jgi:hypothetical protein